MIMEKRKGGMRLIEYSNNSFFCSQDKQHHELNDRTLDDRLHHLWTGQLGMHVSIDLQHKNNEKWYCLIWEDLKRCPEKGQLKIAGQHQFISKEKVQETVGFCVQFFLPN